MQSVSFRIWTRVAVSISYDDNHYTTGTSSTGLNYEFSFSEEPSLPYYYTHSWRENNWIHTFPKGISAMWNAISLVQELNSYRRVHILWR